MDLDSLSLVFIIFFYTFQILIWIDLILLTALIIRTFFAPNVTYFYRLFIFILFCCDITLKIWLCANIHIWKLLICKEARRTWTKPNCLAGHSQIDADLCLSAVIIKLLILSLYSSSWISSKAGWQPTMVSERDQSKTLRFFTKILLFLNIGGNSWEIWTYPFQYKKDRTKNLSLWIWPKNIFLHFKIDQII